MMKRMIEDDITYFEACEKYPNFSKFIILKIDIQRRGYIISDRAVRFIKQRGIYQLRERRLSREEIGNYPVSFLLRDGTSVITRPNFHNNGKIPYEIDVINNKFVVSFEGIKIDEIFPWEKPSFYDKYTSSGTPMWHVANARPLRLDINPVQYCEFWKCMDGCKFCAGQGTYVNTKKISRLNIQDIEETVEEALKEKGRYTSILLTGGSIIGGTNKFDKEVSMYIEVLKKIGEYFDNKKFPSQLIGTAYNRSQLKEIYEETGLMFYTSDIEVLNRDLFRWICPGKSKYVGYDMWKERLFQAVEIFGKGYVSTGIVAGVEMAQPNGFMNEEQALKSTLKEAEVFFRNGVSVVSCIWRIAADSFFSGQSGPSLEFYIKLAIELNRMRKKYIPYVGLDDYRRCGNHPDTDLGRVI